jgi:ParB/RepB/Spo0J family partition protein
MNDGYYELISGYRRRAALELIKAEHALVRIFRNLDDGEAYDLAISENQDRDALTDIERADICLRLQKEGRTIDQIAHRMGWKGDAHVFRHLRVAREAPAILREVLQSRRIRLKAAIVFIDDALALSPDQQRDALSILAEREMSAAEFKRHLKRLSGGREERTRNRPDAIRKLKCGGFVLRATRFESADLDNIARSIEVLQSAIKRARALQRSARCSSPRG